MNNRRICSPWRCMLAFAASVVAGPSLGAQHIAPAAVVAQTRSRGSQQSERLAIADTTAPARHGASRREMHAFWGFLAGAAAGVGSVYIYNRHFAAPCDFDHSRGDCGFAIPLEIVIGFLGGAALGAATGAALPAGS